MHPPIAIALNSIDLLKHILFKDYRLTADLALINRTQERILMTVKNAEHLSMVTVARAIGLEKGPFSQTVTKLEELELIKRVRSTSDKRLIHLELTTKGLRITEAVEESMETHFAQSIAKLTETETQAFFDALATLKKTAQLLTSK